MDERLTWTEYFMNVVDVISQRSTCNRGKPGCIFVKDNQIVTTGYAGSPPGFPHCDEDGHQYELRAPLTKIAAEKYDPNNKDFHLVEHSIHCVRTIHAEQNAIAQAAKRGVSLDGSTCYVSITPCRTCSMLLIGVGVKLVIVKKQCHKAKESINLLHKAGIEILHLDDEIQKYSPLVRQ